MPENRNKPEKLELPKAPKVSQGNKGPNELPFNLQQIQAIPVALEFSKF